MNMKTKEPEIYETNCLVATGDACIRAHEILGGRFWNSFEGINCAPVQKLTALEFEQLKAFIPNLEKADYLITELVPRKSTTVEAIVQATPAVQEMLEDVDAIMRKAKEMSEQHAVKHVSNATFRDKIIFENLALCVAARVIAMMTETEIRRAV